MRQSCTVRVGDFSFLFTILFIAVTLWITVISFLVSSSSTLKLGSMLSRARKNLFSLTIAVIPVSKAVLIHVVFDLRLQWSEAELTLMISSSLKLINTVLIVTSVGSLLSSSFFSLNTFLYSLNPFVR